MIPVIDIHCHPALKVYLLNIDLFDKHMSTRDFNPFSVRCDLPKMETGNVRTIFATHFLPEINLTTECKNVDWLYDGIKFLAPDFTDKFENDYDFNSPFEQTLQMINLLESKVNEARSRGFKVEIAKDFQQYKAGMDEGRTMILHSIEGGHSLGHDFKSTATASDYINNLIKLYEKGVCLITVAHFFPNDLAAPVNGIPPGIRKLLGVAPMNLNLSITPIGEEVVQKMFELGIIVDLTHSTPLVRERIFELNNNKYPLVFSHVGVEHLFYNPKLPKDKYMNPSDDEIKKIAECGGVIGVILDNYWLTGKEEKSIILEEPGFEFIYNTIDYIYRKTGTYDNIAFGSDLDGLTDPSDDIKDCSKYPKLINFLLGKGIAESDINKICNENVMRVLENTWGRA